MHPLILITTHTRFPDLLPPICEIWGLNLIVMPTWEQAIQVDHRGLLIYDPEDTIPPDHILVHPFPIMIFLHRDPNARMGGQSRSQLPVPRYIQQIIIPFDPEELCWRGGKLFFPELDKDWHESTIDVVFPDQRAIWKDILRPTDRSP